MILLRALTALVCDDAAGMGLTPRPRIGNGGTDSEYFDVEIRAAVRTVKKYGLIRMMADSAIVVSSAYEGRVVVGYCDPSLLDVIRGELRKMKADADDEAG